MEENISLFDTDIENEPQIEDTWDDLEIMPDFIQEVKENIEESENKGIKSEETESDEQESSQSTSDVLMGYILHLDEGITTLDKEFASFCKEEHTALVTDLNAANDKIHGLNTELKFTKWTLVAFMIIYILKIALGI